MPSTNRTDNVYPAIAILASGRRKRETGIQSAGMTP
jgi:hypothetical protein